MTDIILKRISAARTALVLDHPFFGALALKLEPQESTRTQTMGTDGRGLFYNRDFVASLDHASLIGLLAHEVMHPAMQHHTRGEGRDHKRWNEACDYAINPMLQESGFTLPPGGLIDPAYKGLTAEQIYAKLDQQQQPQPNGGQNAPQPGSVQGQPQPGAAQQPAPGEVFEAPEPSQDAAEWQVAVKQATQVAKMMGHLPASMQREIERQTAPKVDWRSLLRRFVQECAAADYSWKLPNRRYIAGGLYLPSLRSEAMPPMFIFRDTSGSTEDFLAAFAAEIQSVVDEMQPECVYLVDCDSKVQKVTVFERGEQIVMTVHGGGGTDFRPPFKWAEKEGISPACAIYLTDGDGRYPTSAPDYPVLWAMTNKTIAPWGETVEIQS